MLLWLPCDVWSILNFEWVVMLIGCWPVTMSAWNFQVCVTMLASLSIVIFYVSSASTPTPIVNVIIIVIFFFLLLLLHLIIIIIIFCVSSLDLGSHQHHLVMVRIISVVFIQIVVQKVFRSTHLCIFFGGNFCRFWPQHVAPICPSLADFCEIGMYIWPCKNQKAESIGHDF